MQNIQRNKAVFDFLAKIEILLEKIYKIASQLRGTKSALMAYCKHPD